MDKDKFKLIIYKWEFGLLQTAKHVVESIERAVEVIADEIDKGGELTARVLNSEGELVHWVDHKHPCDDDHPYA